LGINFSSEMAAKCILSEGKF